MMRLAALLLLANKAYSFTIHELIIYSFPDSFCIHLFPITEISPELRDDLLDSQLVFVWKNVGNYNKNEPPCRATGYIMVTEHGNELVPVFEKYSVLPFRRVLIFNTGDIGEYNKDPFLRSVEVGAVDVLIITNQSHIYSLRNEATVANLSYPRDFGGLWRPKFSSGRNFTMSVLDYPPFTYYDGVNGFNGGIEWYIMDVITKGWPTVVKPHENLDWLGARDDVMARTSDVALSGFWRTVLLPELTSSYYYLEVCGTFMVPKPRLLPLSTFLYQIFNPKLYVPFYTMAFVTGNFLYFTERFYPREAQRGYFWRIMEAYKISVMASIVFPKKFSLRLIVTSWCITSLLISTVYSAVFTKIMAKPGYENPINTLKDMVDVGMPWLLKNHVLLDLFNKTSNPYMAKLLNTYVGLKDVKDFDTVAHVANTFDHFVEYPSYIDITTTKLMMLKECYENNYFVFRIVSDWPYERIFNKKMQGFSENGLVVAWKNKVLYGEYSQLKAMPNLFNTYPDGNDAVVLTVAHTLGMFVILFMGLVVAIVAFCYELWSFNRRIEFNL